MVAWIFSNQTYTDLYHIYYAQFMEDYFENGYMDNLIAETVELISPYVEKDPTAFCTYEEFETGVEAVKEFLTLRSESVIGQLEGTIPSTSEGQKEDTSSLIDASDLNINDMGQMNMGNDRGGDKQKSDGFGQDRGGDKQKSDGFGQDAADDNKQKPDGFGQDAADDNKQKPDGFGQDAPGGDKQKPDGSDRDAPDE
jgi:hypothetical protein